MNWMAWTSTTGAFFIAIALLLFVMTVLELKWPTHRRRGFLPISTTRGDRLFMSLLSAAFIHLGGLLLIPAVLWVASILAGLWAVALMRWG